MVQDSVPLPAASARARPKIVFTGTVGAGKTTAIKTISDIPPVTTDARATEKEVAALKHDTTVAMDYGHLLLASGVKVDLYATPGQERFSFMWDILGKNSAGLILLLDLSRPDPERDLHFYLEHFLPIIATAPLLVGLTKQDMAGPELLDRMGMFLQRQTPPIPFMPVDTREASQVKRLVLSLLLRINPDILR